MKAFRTATWAALLATTLPGCTIYQTCAELYRDRRDMGVPLAEACSRGVTFREGALNRRLAEMHCHGNYFAPPALSACLRGIELQENGQEGVVIREGLD